MIEALYNEQLKYDEGSLEYKALQDKIDAFTAVVNKLRELRDAYVNYEHLAPEGGSLNVAVGEDYISAFALDDNDTYTFKYDEIGSCFTNEGEAE